MPSPQEDQMPSPQDYLQLSAAAYNINGSINVAGLPRGWQLLLDVNGAVVEEQTPNGMIAQAFVNKSTNEVVIAYQGTNGLIKSFFNGQLLADAYIAAGVVPAANEDAFVFEGDVKEIVK